MILSLIKKYSIFIPIVLIVVLVSVSLLRRNQQKDGVASQMSDPTGTIIVEAGTGTLLNGGSFSYIKESARGLEAYLGDKGASAVYEVTVTKPGDYELWVKLTDDGLYKPGERNATIVVNNSRTLKYNHVPKDTKGWEWFDIGVATLAEGKNTLVFTKDADTAGAFVMDEFKFTPK